MDRFPSQSSLVSFFCMFCSKQLDISSVRALRCKRCQMTLPEQVAEVILSWLSTVKPEAVSLIKQQEPDLDAPRSVGAVKVS